MKIIIRSILRQRLNSGIIVISLAIGLACFNLILIFINRELKTDAFHVNKDHIYALKCDDPWIPGGKMYHCRFGSAEYMKENFAQVEDFCRLWGGGSQKIVVNSEEYLDKPQILAASSNFFDFFSYSLTTKNSNTVLETDRNLVISSALAKKYFGDENPVGKIITIVNSDMNEDMEISGIFEKPLENTQIGFDMVRLIGEKDSRCYLRLTKNARLEELEQLFSENKEKIPSINTGTPGSYYLEPLIKTYFNTARRASFEISRDRTNLIIALIIGLMIMGVASFNYLGLLTNTLIEKNKEHNIRRIIGSSKFGLVLDFMAENLILTGISFVLSIFLMQEMIPFFNELTGSTITEYYLLRAEQIGLLLGIVILIMLITLLYAMYSIRTDINPALLKSNHSQKVYRVQFPVFNILQLASSIGLIFCSVVIIKQMNFISNKSIGLNKQVVEVRLPGQYADKVATFKEELLKNISIDKVSVVGTSPLLEHFLVLLKYDDGGVEKQYSPAGFTGDENCLTTLGIELIEGPGFSDYPSSNINKCLINESFAKLFADKDLIGKGMPGMESNIIAGIVNDFHYSGLKSLIGPAFISFDNKGSHLMVKATGNQFSKAKDAIAMVWQNLIPDFPVNIESVGDRYEWFHRENKNYIRLIGVCAFISLFLSMIGLFAISFQISRYRTKEIGIRKINGARITDLIIMLNSNFTKWLTIGFIIALPIAWYAMHKWLQNFAYKTEINTWDYIATMIIASCIVLLTVSWQSWRAASRNPVETLRYE